MGALDLTVHDFTAEHGGVAAMSEDDVSSIIDVDVSPPVSEAADG